MAFHLKRFQERYALVCTHECRFKLQPLTSNVKEHSAELFNEAAVRALNVIRCLPGPDSDSRPFAQDGSAVTCLYHQDNCFVRSNNHALFTHTYVQNERKFRDLKAAQR